MIYFKSVSNESQQTWVRYNSKTKQILEFTFFYGFHHCKQQKVWFCINNSKYLEFTKNLLPIKKILFDKAHINFLNTLKNDLND